ncbi:DUF1330 domain-containing protein [Fuscovulum ytuae]|uniref:DUF1330 domain-containing protein n=1 Tax=Fuscovulum ytuae TaxID=3042299 RepID=A0ABY8Q6N9_9RHOB|nr:DUF1330 domain-containing protein [Fuscovulum sp. YMD61]WGV15741.1 DUF1330 domain-containing protein [Fuscovulum sp. YMD61]
MVTVLAFVTISEDAPDALAAYFSVTDPLLKRAGARIVKRFAVNDVVIGTHPSQTVVMVEYPSREAVDSVFKSPEYAAVKAVRDRAFSTYAITIVDDLSSTPSVEQSGR